MHIKVGWFEIYGFSVCACICIFNCKVFLYFRDVLVKPILVHPEGFPVEVTRSAFICPSSKVMHNVPLKSSSTVCSFLRKITMLTYLMHIHLCVEIYFAKLLVPRCTLILVISIQVHTHFNFLALMKEHVKAYCHKCEQHFT